MADIRKEAEFHLCQLFFQLFLLLPVQVYSAIPRVTPDGIYGSGTANAVREFQSIFGLPQTGVVDFATWYKISHIYVGITRIAELV